MVRTRRRPAARASGRLAALSRRATAAAAARASSSRAARFVAARAVCCALLMSVRAGADSTDEARFYLGVEKAVLFNTPEEGLTEEEAESRLLKFGRNQLPEKEDNKMLKLALEFVQPMPLMIWAAIFIEARPAPLARQRSRTVSRPASRGRAPRLAPRCFVTALTTLRRAGPGGVCAAPVRRLDRRYRAPAAAVPERLPRLLRGAEGELPHSAPPGSHGPHLPSVAHAHARTPTPRLAAPSRL